VLTGPGSAVAESWIDPDAIDLNLYGLAYHPDRTGAYRRRLDNRVNPGLAVHYELANNPRRITFAEAGTYEDSGRNWAKFAALGYQFKLGESWRIGGALAVIGSHTYNHGRPFLSAAPLVTYDVGRIKLNAVYFPKVGHYNQVAAFGFYLGIPLTDRAGRSAPER
jgi:hypothetical protein